jgi:tetratricopeptide (TPR) repeat protein
VRDRAWSYSRQPTLPNNMCDLYREGFWMLPIIVTMSSGESAQRWLEKGAEAYAYMRLDEAGEDFQKAVEATRFTGRSRFSQRSITGVTSSYHTAPLPLGTSAKRTAQITQRNSTNGAMAEEHLKKALELEPRDEQAMEYLGLLYFWWKDPATENSARRDDARQIYTRIAEINPRHRFATYVCGLIDYETAFAIIRSTKGFPRPTDEERRRSLRAEVGPLLKESAASFLRSLEVNPNSISAMKSLGDVRSDEAYIAITFRRGAIVANQRLECRAALLE